MLDGYRALLQSEGKSDNTVSSYILHINGYISWVEDTCGEAPPSLYRTNVLDYIAYLRNIKKANARTINAKLSALMSYNKFLIEQGIQNDMAISKKDNIKVQNQYASPSFITKQEVDKFRQEILVKQGRRDYAIVTIMAYGGLRISEVLNLSLCDVDIVSKEIRVSNGKGNKQRIVYINDKIINAVKEYIMERESNSEYLFVSREREKINRTRINQIFNKYSDKITPHTLRHFYCSNAIESGYSIHEVANQAGHSNIHTTLLYSNPTKDIMKEKADLL